MRIYWLPSAILFVMAMISNDLRILAFSALFAFIDVINSFHSTIDIHRIVLDTESSEKQIPKNPAEELSNSNGENDA